MGAEHAWPISDFDPLKPRLGTSPQVVKQGAEPALLDSATLVGAQNLARPKLIEVTYLPLLHAVPSLGRKPPLTLIEVPPGSVHVGALVPASPSPLGTVRGA